RHRTPDAGEGRGRVDRADVPDVSAATARRPPAGRSRHRQRLCSGAWRRCSTDARRDDGARRGVAPVAHRRVLVSLAGARDRAAGIAPYAIRRTLNTTEKPMRKKSFTFVALVTLGLSLA